jgi:hypothetical protein
MVDFAISRDARSFRAAQVFECGAFTIFANGRNASERESLGRARFTRGGGRYARVTTEQITKPFATSKRRDIRLNSIRTTFAKPWGFLTGFLHASCIDTSARRFERTRASEYATITLLQKRTFRNGRSTLVSASKRMHASAIRIRAWIAKSSSFCANRTLHCREVTIQARFTIERPIARCIGIARRDTNETVRISA